MTDLRDLTDDQLMREFSDSKFRDEILRRLADLRAERDEARSHHEIEVEGYCARTLAAEASRDAAVKALRMCASTAGTPDAAQACRNVIAIVNDALASIDKEA